MRHSLVTGGRGFIGSHPVVQHLDEGYWQVTVLENYDPFCPRAVKEQNLAADRGNERLRIVEGDGRDWAAVGRCAETPVDVVVHLIGVRPQLEGQSGYQYNNVGGLQTLLEAVGERETDQLVFASFSRVYGVSPDSPRREDDSVLRPISPYAATNVPGEFLGHVYSHLCEIHFVALRHCTVYRPRQRPDPGIHKFARRIQGGVPIPVFGDGTSSPDDTYTGDTVAAIRAAMENRCTSYDVINLGDDRTVSLYDMIAALEPAQDRSASCGALPDQPGGVPPTWANITRARDRLDYRQQTDSAAGIRSFTAWLRKETAL